MTRAQAIGQVGIWLDEMAERAITEFFDEHPYDVRTERELRQEVAEWKRVQMAEIERRMAETVRSMLN
jgi:hypothetical protein